ncbi:hypothetical protein AWJ24_22850 [Escherichia coli]|nr:hypothetical protein AUQ34_18075 [Escherichia coli]OKU74544.1 hypothetical protein AWJ24_22850 [Escherichia coli]OKV69025.1 hypothetical protein AWP57_14435 [Escherichia coli]OKV92615.1 hypothetical protein AWP64_02030 [Escherichia coli]OKV97073.1 hypothetical protein AWP68_24720 [Escherichia coli]
MEKESGLSPSFSGRNGDGQSAKPDDRAGYAGQRPHRITGVPVGVILSTNSGLFNKLHKIIMVTANLGQCTLELLAFFSKEGILKQHD